MQSNPDAVTSSADLYLYGHEWLEVLDYRRNLQYLLIEFWVISGRNGIG